MSEERGVAGPRDNIGFIEIDQRFYPLLCCVRRLRRSGGRKQPA